MLFGKIFARRFKECLKALNAGEVDDSDEDAGPRKRVQGIFDKFLDTDDDVFFGKKIIKKTKNYIHERLEELKRLVPTVIFTFPTLFYISMNHLTVGI